MTVRKKRKRKNRLHACDGRISTFIGPLLRRKADYISDVERISLAELARLAFGSLIEGYERTGKLPVVQNMKQYRRPIGRPRLYESQGRRE